MTIQQVLTFSVAAFVLIAIPGPSVLFVLGRALVLPPRGALASILGNALGEFLLVIGVAFGLGTVIERSLAVFTIVKLAGAAYLIFLGIRAFRARHSLAAELAAPVRAERAMLQGFAVGVTNPKSAIFFAAVLPQFIDRGAGYAPLQMIALGGIYFLIALITDTTWSISAGAARSWLARSPRRLAAIGGVSGLTMVGLGASLAVSGRRD